MTKANVALLLCLAAGAGLWSSAASAPAAGTGVTIERDVVAGHKAGLALTFDVVCPRERQNGAGVVFIVSGGWYSEWFPPERLVRAERERANVFEQLVERGFALFVVRHGSSPWFLVPDAVSDVRRAVRAIRSRAADFGVDPERLGVFGASAGGHLALMLGTGADAGDAGSDDPVERTSDRVAAVVAHFAPSDLRDAVAPESRWRALFPALRFDAELAPQLSPLLLVTPDDAPALLLHGDKDELVALRHSERMHAALRASGVASELVVIAGAEHGFEGADKERADAALIAWFEQHLLKSE